MDISNINLKNLSTYLNAWEMGDLEAGDTIDLFQVLLDTSIIDHLDDRYQLAADIMIKDNQICADWYQAHKAHSDSNLANQLVTNLDIQLSQPTNQEQG
tara:strand:- start:1171 stop:1467 length:297 start_codon:yes stop_codon:yes gene_type:complete